MPTTHRIGQESAANKTIGGVPTIHYLDFMSRGRGQVVRLFWIDAGIAFDDVRYNNDEYPEYKRTKIAEMNPNATIPVVELNGRILVQSYAMLRHFARLLGKYEGESEEEKYWADAMCDLTIDWRSAFVNAFFQPNKDVEYPRHMAEKRPQFLQALEQHLSSNSMSASGPYVLGNKITYADLVIYQVCHDEQLTQDGRAGLKGYPRLAKLADAVEGRENVRKFLQSAEYKG
ncbi:hypothetical protein KC354_g7444 [Hortaea werneckii]|uniref:Glutathione S-transferase n=1 Tax=Hortaea werneckii TaxID=91943 RepID=A0A3M7DLJ9_HORWE|nr:hypothetical protein KC354_g7444 [Hortaea werneckii]RMY65258.1 hypothetical protein D0863_09237 [Hortaea werneckii]